VSRECRYVGSCQGCRACRASRYCRVERVKVLSECLACGASGEHFERVSEYNVSSELKVLSESNVSSI
jgi:hypothetical protein